MGQYYIPHSCFDIYWDIFNIGETRAFIFMKNMVSRHLTFSIWCSLIFIIYTYDTFFGYFLHNMSKGDTCSFDLTFFNLKRELSCVITWIAWVLGTLYLPAWHTRACVAAISASKCDTDLVHLSQVVADCNI